MWFAICSTISMKDDGKDKQQDFEDDGRVVASMNIEGMPWYSGRSGSPLRRRKRGEDSDDAPPIPEHEQMTRAENRQYMLSALLAGLVIGLIFIAGFAIFIGLLVLLW